MKDTLVAAHDAGAANHIIAWLLSGTLDVNRCYLCFEGPAATLYRQHVKTYVAPASQALVPSSIKRVISGTGWATAYEHETRLWAQENALESIAVVDHWTNYRERFVRGGCTILPHEIWVVDHYAEKIAHQSFAGITVKRQPNDFVASQIKAINSNSGVGGHPNNSILFLMEPIRQSWGSGHIPGEVQALQFFVANKGAIGLDNKVDICIKPHPSDPQGKYDQWTGESSVANIWINSSSSLPELIAQSEIIVGCQTYAMVIALAAGKKVVSALPPGASECLLPHDGIIHLKEQVIFTEKCSL